MMQTIQGTIMMLWMMFVFNGVMVILVTTIISLAIKATKEHTNEMRRQFELQMAMAKAQESVTNPLTFDDLRKLIEGIIVNIAHMEIINNGYAKLNSDELSIYFDAIIEEISVKTESTLSPEMIRQWGKFASTEYRTNFIIFTARTAFMLQVSNEVEKIKKSSPVYMQPTKRPPANQK